MPKRTTTAAPQPSLFERELVIDLFAGAGGASTGLAEAYREPDIAVNHNPIAVAVHRINHPKTVHYTCDVFEVDPLLATGGRPVGVLWASPDCRHHSKAAGRAPRSKRVRGLAWVVTKWAAACKPRVIFLENVEEFADWGPLLPDGSPCQIRKGITYRRWKRKLQRLGYVVEERELVAADYEDTPTTRKRLYVIARRDGEPIIWPAPTNAKTPAKTLRPWRTAADCIDFERPACSIFATKAEAKAWARKHKLRGTPQRPLKGNTLRRVAKGLSRYLINCPTPFIVPLRGTSTGHMSTHRVDDPLATVSAGGTHHALVTPLVVPNNTNNVPKPGNHPVPTVTTGNRNLLAEAVLSPYLTEHANASKQRVFPADEPMRTQVAQVKGGHFSVIAPTLIEAAHSDESPSGVKRWADGTKDLGSPMGTVHAGGGNFALATAHIAKFRGDSAGTAANAPMPTVTAGGAMKRNAGAAHALGVVSAFMEQANTGMVGHDMREPVSTIVGAGSTQRLVTAFLVKYYREGGQWSGLDEPMHTVPTRARMAIVQSVQVPQDIIAPALRRRARQVAHFLHEHLPAQFPTKADMILIGDYVLADITLRMLVPRELARAQGFADTYVIDRGLFETEPGSGRYEVKPINQTDQVRLIGNSVCRGVAKALARANLARILALYAQEDALTA